MQKELNTMQKYLFLFFAYAMAGWLYETALEVIIFQEGYTNRGFLFGPICPIYGFGAISMLTFYNTFVKERTLDKSDNMKLIITFFSCMVIATIIELITSYLLEFAIGTWLWTYKDYPFNFEGRVSLPASTVFGIGGVLFLYVLQPKMENYIQKANVKAQILLIRMATVLLCVDCATTFMRRLT